jgi:hypothetical protein
MRIEYPGQMYVHPQYALLALDVVVRYLRLMVMPAGQTIFHSVSAVESVADVRVIAAVVVIGVLLTLAWRLRFSQGMAAMGILWFFLLLVPAAVLTVLDSGEPMAEHRVYVASCGLFLAPASAIGWLYERLEQETERAAAIAGSFVIIVVAAMSVQTVMRNAVWSDPVRLWKESVDLAPAHYRPRLLLGEALQDQGRRAEAVTEYETAVRLNPSNVMGYMKLGTCLAELGDIERARTAYRRAASLQPSYEPAQRALALMQQVQPK